MDTQQGQLSVTQRGRSECRGLGASVSGRREQVSAEDESFWARPSLPFLEQRLYPERQNHSKFPRFSHQGDSWVTFTENKAIYVQGEAG